MSPIWLILGIVMIGLGIFHKQIGQRLNIKSMSETSTIPNLKRSSRMVEKLGQWLVIILGASFLVYGLGSSLPNEISYKISFSLLVVSGLMILAMIGITIVNWRAR